MPVVNPQDFGWNVTRFPNSNGEGWTEHKIRRMEPLPEADGGGKRHDDGKNRLDLLPPEWAWALADVTTKGSYKYDERNWERGMRWGKMVGCAGRHLTRFLMGERYDDETGCHHLAMAAWNLLALMSYDIRGIGHASLPDTDDPLEYTDRGLQILARVNSGDPGNPKIREALGLPVGKDTAEDEATP